MQRPHSSVGDIHSLCETCISLCLYSWHPVDIFLFVFLVSAQVRALHLSIGYVACKACFVRIAMGKCREADFRKAYVESDPWCTEIITATMRSLTWLHDVLVTHGVWRVRDLCISLAWLIREEASFHAFYLLVQWNPSYPHDSQMNKRWNRWQYSYSQQTLWE